MNSFEKILKILSPFGVYRIEKGSNIYSELRAYAAGLDILAQELCELECEAFIPTSQSYGLERRERLFGAVRDDLDTAQRREMLLKRSAFGNADFTLEGIGRILDFLGIQGEIKEYPNVNRVVVEVQNEGLTKGQRNWIVSQLGALFPAHLEVDGVFEGFSWEQIDANGYDFAQMEATLRTWFEIDYYCM